MRAKSGLRRVESFLQRQAVRVEEIGARGREGVEALFLRAGDRGGEAEGDGEAGFGEIDRGLEEVGPGQAAVIGMDAFHEFEGAGHACRPSAAHGVPEAHRLAVGADPVFRRGGGGRGLAAVEGGERAERVVPVEREGAAADAGALRLDEVEHHLDRHGGVGGGPARAQDFGAGLGRERVGGGDHEIGGRDGDLLGDGGGGLGLDARVLAPGGCGDQRGREQRHACRIHRLFPRLRALRKV